MPNPVPFWANPQNKEIIMKKLLISATIIIVFFCVWALIPVTAHPHENNGKKLMVDGEAIGCGGQGDQCYWEVPETAGPGGY